MPITDKLTSIANAIREKGGTTDKLTLDAMPNAIAALSTGGGSGDDGVPNPITYSEDCSYLFANNRNKWILDNYFDRVKMIDVSTLDSVFLNASKIERTPEINCQSGSPSHMAYAFSGCYNLKEIGDINNCKPRQNIRNLFTSCHNLRYLPNFNNVDFTVFHEYTLAYMYSIFDCCYSLRSIDKDLLKELWHPKTTTLYTSTFNKCYVLDEIVGLSPRSNESKATTSNMFSDTFTECYRVKNIIFDTQENGTPYTAQWKNQTIDLSKYVGWAGAANADRYILNYNSGITAEDEDNDWSNNPNYWSRQFMNSRFNHDSAVEFINSLPDTSAYVAAQNAANNAVKFYTNAGSATPGGGVNALTEEEIAVAAAKGWSIGYTV